MQVISNGIKISLDKRNFVARGGQGSVYSDGRTAYKIYHDPKNMIPKEKMCRLQEIQHASVVSPKDDVTTTKGKRIGYAMNFVNDTYTLCQLFPRVFKERNRITPNTIVSLVLKLREALVAIHRNDIYAVDLNELNILTSQNFETPYLIDVDSYQTPGYPAIVIMPSVRDWHTPVAKYGEGSDWFSFAVVTFQLFIGIHPYKGKHPDVKGLENRMKANLTVFDKDVRVPQACYNVETIPKLYRDWYRAVLVNQERCAPPENVVAVAVSVPLTTIKSSDKLEIKFVRNYKKKPIDVGYLQYALGTSFSETAEFLDGVYVRSGSQILEVVDLPNLCRGKRLAAEVMPRSSKLYPGVVVQSLLGTTYVSLFPKRGYCYQVRIQELDGAKITDAKFESGVLMIVAAKNGVYNKHIFRFDVGYSSYDHRIVKDIIPSGINFVVTDRNICVSLTEEEKIEAFLAIKGAKSIKIIEDSTLGNDMELVKHNGGVGFIRNNKLYSMRLK